MKTPANYAANAQGGRGGMGDKGSKGGKGGNNLVVARSSLLEPTDEDIALVRSYLTASLSPNTLSCYRNDLKQFIKWGGQIPASPEMIATYIARHAEKHTPTTLARRLVAISWAHGVKGLLSPTQSPLVKATIQGIRRKRGRPPKQAAPLLKADVLRLVRGLRGKRGLRDKAMLLIGFAAAFRRSELVSLDVDDLEFVAEGLVIHLRRSKTDQEGKGREIAIPYVSNRNCPCRVLQKWLRASGIQEGAVFRRIDKAENVLAGRLGAQAVSLVIKHRAAEAGLDPAMYSGHSLRAGFATSAVKAGAPTASIRAQTGHQSDAMLQRYIRYSELFSENANKNLW